MSGIWDTLTRKLWDWYKGHEGDVDAHHTKYTDAEVDTIVGSHAGISAAHHSKYTDADVITALGIKNVFFDNNKIGIGTTTPKEGLHIYNGNIRIGNQSDGYARIYIDNKPYQDKPMILMNAVSANTGDFSTVCFGGGTTGGYAATIIEFYTSVNRTTLKGTERMRITSVGNIGIATKTPTAKLDINSDLFRLRTAKTPSSASDTGNAGDICKDANYIYVCTATNTWKRTALSTW